MNAAVLSAIVSGGFGATTSVVSWFLNRFENRPSQERDEARDVATFWEGQFKAVRLENTQLTARLSEVESQSEALREQHRDDRAEWTESILEAQRDVIECRRRNDEYLARIDTLEHARTLPANALPHGGDP